jgi:hypothetical protein
VGTDNHSGAFTAALSGLTAGTTYYFETYATNAGGQENGTVSSFITVAISAPVSPKGAIFADVPNSFWAYGDIENLNGLGYVSGYPDGTFEPNNNITRAEFVTIMDNVLKLTPNAMQITTFSDVNASDWYYQSVQAAVYAGIVRGNGDGSFQPNAPISRQEAAAILVQALGNAGAAETLMNAQTGFTDDSSIAAWARGFVSEASKIGLIKGYTDNTFAPQQDATRAEACVMIDNFLTLQGNQ